MTRPTDPRGASRRGSTDASDIGYTAANGATASRGKRWPAPDNIRGINAAIRQRERTGLCVVCGQPAGDIGGATCKEVVCIRAFVMGRMTSPEFAAPETGAMEY
jgi:hypothetical protein